MKLSFLLLVLLSIGFCKDCLDTNNRPVDYWFILKLPKDNVNKLSGWEYLYCDSKNKCADLTLMSDKLGDSTSPLQKTIAQIDIDKTSGSIKNDEVSVIWSDQPYPSFKSSNKAHSKGMLTVSSKTKHGFIINHSLPNFPVFDKFRPNKIIPGVPSTGQRFAQHFFCVSLHIDQIEKLARQYKIAQIITHLTQFPKIDPTKLPLELHGFEGYPNILSLENTDRVTARWGIDTIRSKGGLIMRVFSTSEGIENHEIKITIPRLHPIPSPVDDSTESEEDVSPAKKPRHSNILSKNTKNLKEKKHKHQEISSFLFMHDSNKLFLQERVDDKYNGFFDQLVAPGLKQNIVMSTWGLGKPRVQAQVCGEYESLSAENRTHKLSASFDYKFSYKKDHSKFGITFPDGDEVVDNDDDHDTDADDDTKFKKWIIVADLNRQLLQTSRGGTAISFKNKYLWEILDKSLIDRQKCP